MAIPSSIYRYLEKQAAQQREVTKNLTSDDSTVQQRKDVLIALDQIALHFNGYFRAIEDLEGPEVARYLREYFDQAASDEGLRFKELKEPRF